jgi:hypothetical protein
MGKIMARHSILPAMAAAALGLAAVGPSWAQSTLPQENAMRAAEQAVADKARAAVEAAKITFFHQVYHVIRHVYLDGPLKLEDRDVLWEGHSSGRWEGGALIIESGDFNGQQWVDNTGLPQSPDMRVSERFKLMDANTLEDRITFDDAKYYTAPWTARLLFKRQPSSTLLVEEDCAEKLLDFPMKPYAPD